MGKLKQSGFVLLNLPQSQVKPLDLLVKSSKGHLERLNASLEDVFEGVTIACPSPSEDMPLASIDLSEEFELNVNVKVGFLQGLLKAFNLSGDLEVGGERESDLAIKLNAPVQNILNVVVLSKFIEDANIKDVSQFVEQLLEDGDLYIVTEVIKAKQFTIAKKNASMHEVGLQAGKSGVAEVKGNMKTASGDNLQLEYDGDAYQVFALKALKIQKLRDRPGKFTLKFTSQDYKKVLLGPLEGELLISEDEPSKLILT